jgi:SAM-dependent methyltransferase
MALQDKKIVSRAWRRVGRLSTRFRERIQGLPLRTSERKLGRPIPPGRLIHLIANTEDVCWFINTGEKASRSIRDILRKNGLAIEAFGAILDFGCGVGRVIRQWDGLEGPTLHGTDYNPVLVDWCRSNLPFARFQVNGLDRPLEMARASFSFVYCLSVFTHLSEPLQHFWMSELGRILEPGGYLLITVHGDHYRSMLSPVERERYDSGRLVVQKATREGSNDCAAFHPEGYVRGTLAKDFKVVDMIPEGALGNPSQDLYLLRKSLG